MQKKELVESYLLHITAKTAFRKLFSKEYRKH